MKMKTFGRFVALAAFAMAWVVCTACSSSGSLRSDKESHKRVSQVLNLGYFSRVESCTSYDVKFVQGKTPSVRVVGAKGLVERLSVQRSGETLVIKAKGGGFSFSFDDDTPLTIYITSPDLTGVKLTGSGDFDVDGPLDTDVLDVALEGSGDIDFNSVVCDHAKIRMSGSGDIDIKDIKAQTVSCEVNGSGDVDLGLNRVGVSTLKVFGSGDIEAKMYDCGTSDCSVFGSGDITLKGTLRSLNQNVKGSGDINTGELSVAN